MKPLVRHKTERRERILEAAREVIGERGYDALTMRDAGQLAAWVDEQALCERLLSHLLFTSMQWASGALTRETLRATSLYEACLMLMAVTEDDTRGALQRQAVRLQTRARVGQTAPVSARRATAGGGA